ncbi:MAG: uracil phosphoribosyltransferase [Acutalibacteraceae bacterium]|nr:uracil phosphoribosyltransferase [Acutalibacteraceae bacterium]
MSKLIVLDHPLIQHKMAILRDEETKSGQFRTLVEEITMLMCFESMRDLPVVEKEVKTPLKVAKCNVLAGRNPAVVPILRAGLGMVNGVLNLVPSARVGHIGMYRDEETMMPQPYYCKLPSNIEQRKIFVVDPMLATGGSAIDAISQVKSLGGKDITFMCLVAAPRGVNALQEAHPDVDIYCASLDEGLNEKCYILPGLGDAGDRIFGTK